MPADHHAMSEMLFQCSWPAALGGVGSPTGALAGHGASIERKMCLAGIKRIRGEVGCAVPRTGAGTAMGCVPGRQVAAGAYIRKGAKSVLRDKATLGLAETKVCSDLRRERTVATHRQTHCRCFVAQGISTAHIKRLSHQDEWSFRV